MRWLWFGLGFLAAGIFLLAQWPATMTARWIERNGPVSLERPSGTVWRGRAENLAVDGLNAGALTWELSPWSLLRLRPTAQLELAGPAFTAQSEVQRRPGGGLRLASTRARLPGEWLQTVLAETGLGLRGIVTLDFDHALLDADGWLIALEGAARWTRAQVVGSIVVELGTLQVVWRTPQQGRIVGRLGDAGGPLELDGQVLIEGRQYRIEARVRSRGYNPALENTLHSLSRPDADGWVTLNWQGPMLPLGDGP